MDGLVFEMQQLQRDVLAALVLAVHVQPFGFGPIRSNTLVRAFEQTRFDDRGVHVLGQWPAQTGPLGARQIIVHARPADSDAQRSVLAEILRRQAQYFADMAHA